MTGSKRDKLLCYCEYALFGLNFYFSCLLLSFFQVRSEVHQREQGLEALRRVEQQFCELPAGYSLDQAKAVLEELCSVQRSLGKGHREKTELLQVS